MCKIEYNSSQGLWHHNKSKHFGNKYQCELCRYSTFQSGDLLRHMKQVHEAVENVTCTECNKSVKPQCMKQHMRNMHNGERATLTCNMCTFQTKWERSLQIHIERMHIISNK